jgi:uncharacterized damage-inducible protein DinB
MSSSLLGAAFTHHVWATTRVIDACLDLRPEALETSVIGTRGPILDTLRHLVLSDVFDLFTVTGDPAFVIDDAHVSSLAEARAVMERSGSGWSEYLSRVLDADEVVLEVDPNDGFRRWAPVGFRLAGVLEHGTDHRSQVCTALTSLGMTPPKIDVFTFGLETGRIVEQLPGS